jgi:nitrate/nitrite transport system substrate-binding protein
MTMTASATLEKTSLKIGVVPLVDCAPIIVAKERGFFAELGLEVDISKEASWASIRDKVAVGVLDGAHLLAPLPLAMTAGVAALNVPMIVGMALNLGGNTIVVADSLCKGVDPKHPISARFLATKLPLTFATVYPVSSHTYELRAWLRNGGIDPDRDVQFKTVPPQRMVAELASGTIAGFCVGEPWGSMAVHLGLGRIVATSSDIFAGRLEKVFAVTQMWAETHPNTHLTLLEALIGAARWCDDNRQQTTEILAQPHWLNAPTDVIAASLLGEQGLPLDLIRFHCNAANFPWRSQARWYLSQMTESGRLPTGIDHVALAASVFQPDLYRAAAARLGISTPLSDDKTEGTHNGTWELPGSLGPIAMGPDVI